MDNSLLDVIIVGAGQAGLSASYYLKNAKLKHIVFERAKIGESWRSQRWHSFKMNSVNHLNLLPGARLNGNDPDAFCTHTDFVASLEKYAVAFQLPVLENVNVISIEKRSGIFKVLVSQHDSVKEYRSKQIIIASGLQNERKIPTFTKNVSSEIKQLHTSEYRNAGKLPEGAILVVGSAQSGVQIAEELIEEGRRVYLSTSMAGRVPRRYRGKDIMDWLLMLGYFDLKTEDVTDHKEFAMRAPQLTGTGGHAHTISLQYLAKKGAVILGRMENANDKNVLFQPNAKQHVQFADMVSGKIKSMIDAFIQKTQSPAPPAEEDAADIPDLDGSCASFFTELNLKEHNITSIVWTTGFRGNFNYIKLPVLDADGNPKHKNGISPVEGLYYLGFGWLRSRKSGLIHGIKDDAEFIIEKVRKFSSLKVLETPVTT